MTLKLSSLEQNPPLNRTEYANLRQKQQEPDGWQKPVLYTALAIAALGAVVLSIRSGIFSTSGGYSSYPGTYGGDYSGGGTGSSPTPTPKPSFVPSHSPRPQPIPENIDIKPTGKSASDYIANLLFWQSIHSRVFSPKQGQELPNNANSDLQLSMQEIKPSNTQSFLKIQEGLGGTSLFNISSNLGPLTLLPSPSLITPTSSIVSVPSPTETNASENTDVKPTGKSASDYITNLLFWQSIHSRVFSSKQGQELPNNANSDLPLKMQKIKQSNTPKIQGGLGGTSLFNISSNFGPLTPLARSSLTTPTSSIVSVPSSTEKTASENTDIKPTGKSASDYITNLLFWQSIHSRVFSPKQGQELPNNANSDSPIRQQEIEPSNTPSFLNIQGGLDDTSLFNIFSNLGPSPQSPSISLTTPKSSDEKPVLPNRPGTPAPAPRPRSFTPSCTPAPIPPKTQNTNAESIGQSEENDRKSEGAMNIYDSPELAISGAPKSGQILIPFLPLKPKQIQHLKNAETHNTTDLSFRLKDLTT